MRPHLKGRNIDVVCVRLCGNGYFEALAKQLLFEIDRLKGARSDVRFFVILVSAIAEDKLDDEYVSFFPALIRLGIQKDQANNKSATKKIVERIDALFRDESFVDLIKTVSARKKSHLLLPVRNAAETSLRKMFDEIYAGGELRSKEGRFSAELEIFEKTVLKKITVIRRSKALKMGAISFAPVLNGPAHPIRRCTDTAVCDVKAKLRFGALVAERFEFDVTCDRKLSAKSFYLCGGGDIKPSQEDTHLNMRINDDFKGG
ncbi:hypothetical protein C8J30_12230 [Rhodobacter viridis]|uniref:Uncharacterized protein n=2 Tax=Rhodobacter viridis TaxID=1054202 RepID=A0A318TSP4_9RHOB|nr:hypothetical protein C8J30_12230 [Rhodobacter viridis]